MLLDWRCGKISSYQSKDIEAKDVTPANTHQLTQKREKVTQLIHSPSHLAGIAQVHTLTVESVLLKAKFVIFTVEPTAFLKFAKVKVYSLFLILTTVCKKERNLYTHYSSNSLLMHKFPIQKDIYTLLPNLLLPKPPE